MRSLNKRLYRAKYLSDSERRLGVISSSRKTLSPRSAFIECEGEEKKLPRQTSANGARGRNRTKVERKKKLNLVSPAKRFRICVSFACHHVPWLGGNNEASSTAERGNKESGIELRSTYFPLLFYFQLPPQFSLIFKLLLATSPSGCSRKSRFNIISLQ